MASPGDKAGEDAPGGLSKTGERLAMGRDSQAEAGVAGERSIGAAAVGL